MTIFLKQYFEKINLENENEFFICGIDHLIRKVEKYQRGIHESQHIQQDYKDSLEVSRRFL